MTDNKPSELIKRCDWLDVLIKHDLSAYDKAFNTLIDLEDKLRQSDAALSILATAIESVQGKIDLVNKGSMDEGCENCEHYDRPTYSLPCRNCKEYSLWLPE